MQNQQAFGGSWTQEKLERLSGYLHAYMQIFKSQTWATTYYVDAFAGTGTIPSKQDAQDSQDAILDEEDQMVAFREGSARISLRTNPPFNHYLFIEKDIDKVAELHNLKKDFPDRNIEIVQSEANEYLSNWIDHNNWINTRAVVFLDPYGMEVKWQVLEKIAQTQAIDL